MGSVLPLNLFAAVLFLSAMFVGGPVASAQVYETRVRSCLVFRNYNKKQIGCVRSGQDIQVIKHRPGGFSEVRVNGRKGLVFSRYIRPKAQAPAKAPAQAKAQAQAKAPVATAVTTPPVAPEIKTSEDKIEPVRPVGARGYPPITTAPKLEPVKPTIINPGTVNEDGTTVTAGPRPEPAKPAPQPTVRPMSPQALQEVAESVIEDRSSKYRPFKVGNSSICDFGGDTLMEGNCKRLMQKVATGELPRPAVEYALKTFRQVTGKFCGGKTINEQFRNRCSFFVTDLDNRWKGMSHRSPAYLIDLCAGDSRRSDNSSLVYSTYTNRGTGTEKYGYRDSDGKKTTLAGVFMTGELTGFDPYHKSRSKYAKLVGYRANDPNCDGQGTHANGFLKNCGVIRLSVERIGLSPTRTDDQKPMHTSGFKSSAGCPSLGKQDNKIMRHLASRGNSMYVAYTSKSSEREHLDAPYDASLCKTDPDLPFGLAQAPNSQGSDASR